MTQTEFEILLVEDNQSDAEMTIRALKKSMSMTTVLHLKDGSQALDYIFGNGIYQGRNTQLQPRVIFLDLKMPKVDGAEVLLQIKSNGLTKKIPVVVFSSSKEVLDIQHCYLIGANSYVVKPMEYAQFMETVSGMGRYWLNQNQPPV